MLEFPNVLSDRFNWEIHAFADAVREVCSVLTGIAANAFKDADVKCGVLGEVWQKMDSDGASVPYTGRSFLQTVGTDAIRNVVHENVWVYALMSKYNEQNWIITDVRFPNEAQSVRDRGGILVRISRTQSIIAPHLEPRITKSTNQHISETALDDYTFDVTINNNGSIEELIDQIKNKVLPLIN